MSRKPETLSNFKREASTKPKILGLSELVRKDFKRTYTSNSKLLGDSEFRRKLLIKSKTRSSFKQEF